MTRQTYKQSWYRNNRERIAKQLAEDQRLYPDKYRNKNLLFCYGLSLDDFNKMLKAQHGRCAICKLKPEGRLGVDHSHQTKKVRGLLCRKCNFGIGLFNDDPALVTKAAEYLRRTNAK